MPTGCGSVISDGNLSVILSGIAGSRTLANLITGGGLDLRMSYLG